MMDALRFTGSFVPGLPVWFEVPLGLPIPLDIEPVIEPPFEGKELSGGLKLPLGVDS